MTVINGRKSIPVKSEVRRLDLTIVWVKEHQLIYLVLLLGFFVGYVYYSISPPWQHYDEPAQFEYAWLIANKPGLPNRGDFDQSIRREIAASMMEHNFFRDLSFSPNLVDLKPIWIGISQIGELPLYYWIAALPLRLFRFSDVIFQLKVVRLVSIIFYLVTILAAYGIACELTTRKGHPLRWTLPISVALLPSFVDLMTAVNDDVGAVAFFSVFLWIGVRLIMKGFSFPRSCFLVLFALFSFWTKNTVVVAVILLLIPILFSIFRGVKQKYAWLAFSAGTLALIMVSISWGDAAYWYRSSPEKTSTRATVSSSPLGNSAIRISARTGEVPPRLTQVIPNAKKDKLLDQPVTLGAWIWASEPAQVRTPMIINEDQVIYKDVQVDEDPRFFMLTTELEPKSRPLIVSISPFKTRSKQELTIYYDGVVLTPGNHPQDKMPEFNKTGEGGIWNGIEFINFIRNSSGETTWPFIRSWADNLLNKYFPGRPSLVLASIMDFQNFRTYYRITIKTLFQSFWGRFGWGNVSLSGFHPYLILGIYTLIGVLGAIISLIRNRFRINWAMFLFLGLPVLTIWSLTLARGVPSFLGERFIVPVARYAYPAIIPTMLMIDLGWLEIGRFGNNFLKMPIKVVYAGLVCFLVGLNVVSIYSILRFY